MKEDQNQRIGSTIVNNSNWRLSFCSAASGFANANHPGNDIARLDATSSLLARCRYFGRSPTPTIKHRPADDSGGNGDQFHIGNVNIVPPVIEQVSNRARGAPMCSNSAMRCKIRAVSGSPPQ